jgi:hypothetical protein
VTETWIDVALSDHKVLHLLLINLLNGPAERIRKVQPGRNRNLRRRMRGGEGRRRRRWAKKESRLLYTHYSRTFVMNRCLM